MDSLVIGLLGGGTLATLVAVLLHYRADNARTYAEGRKLNAEGDATAGDSVQHRYDQLFDALEADNARLRADLDAARKVAADALEDAARLRVGFSEATAGVNLARAEVTMLQDRLDRLEHLP